MAARGMQRGSQIYPATILIAMSLLLIQCGQDPSFQTNGAGVLEEDMNSSANSTIGDPTDPAYRTKQAMYCQEEGIADESCFNFKLVSMTAQQPQPGSVDILWVVDSSGSMTEEQSYLGNNFEMFINRVIESDINFQVAVTSTDVCQNPVPANLAEVRCPSAPSNGVQGAFIGTAGNTVLKESTPNLVSTFKSYATVGINGSGFEHGLKGAELAVSRVLNGQNEMLIRDNSFLAVIVVSDEEDDGIGLSQVDSYTGRNFTAEGLTSFKFTEDDLINYLKIVKGDGQFAVSTITGTRDANTGNLCTSAHSQPLEEGTQYIKAADKTGGIVQSICETAWDTALSDMGNDIGAQITQLVLEYPAEPDTIKVYVNGTLETNWSYVPAANSVKFSADHVPAAGAAIAVEYLTKN